MPSSVLGNVGIQRQCCTRRFSGKWRRATVWILAAVVAACSSTSTDVVTSADVGSVFITPPTTTVRVGSQIPLQALVQDPGGKTIPGTDVFWSVQNPNIATVSAAGVVTGVALGSTQVAASVNGKSGIATITVSPAAVATVTVTPSPLPDVGRTDDAARGHGEGSERDRRDESRRHHGRRATRRSPPLREASSPASRPGRRPSPRPAKARVERRR